MKGQLLLITTISWKLKPSILEYYYSCQAIVQMCVTDMNLHILNLGISEGL